MAPPQQQIPYDYGQALQAMRPPNNHAPPPRQPFHNDGFLSHTMVPPQQLQQQQQLGWANNLQHVSSRLSMHQHQHQQQAAATATATGHVVGPCTTPAGAAAPNAAAAAIAGRALAAGCGRVLPPRVMSTYRERGGSSELAAPDGGGVSAGAPAGAGGCGGKRGAASPPDVGRPNKKHRAIASAPVTATAHVTTASPGDAAIQAIQAMLPPPYHNDGLLPHTMVPPQQLQQQQQIGWDNNLQHVSARLTTPEGAAAANAVAAPIAGAPAAAPDGGGVSDLAKATPDPQTGLARIEATKEFLQQKTLWYEQPTSALEDVDRIEGGFDRDAFLKRRAASPPPRSTATASAPVTATAHGTTTSAADAAAAAPAAAAADIADAAPSGGGVSAGVPAAAAGGGGKRGAASPPPQPQQPCHNDGFLSHTMVPPQQLQQHQQLGWDNNHQHALARLRLFYDLENARLDPHSRAQRLQTGLARIDAEEELRLDRMKLQHIQAMLPPPYHNDGLISHTMVPPQLLQQQQQPGWDNNLQHVSARLTTPEGASAANAVAAAIAGAPAAAGGGGGKRRAASPPPTLDAQNYPEQLPPHQLQSPQQLMAPPHQLLMLLLLLPSLVPLQLLLMVVR
jgi:hypothetical protein